MNAGGDAVSRVPGSADGNGGPTGTGSGSLMEVRGLVKRFPVRRGLLQRVKGEVRAVDGVDSDFRSGECFALVGESGSGKSAGVMGLMGLNRSPNAAFRGTATYKGSELIGATEDELRQALEPWHVLGAEAGFDTNRAEVAG